MWGHLCTELENLHNFNVSFSTHKSEVLLHLSQWQYWWWFWFSFFWTFYFFVILRVVKHRVFKMGLRLNTSLRSRGKWGDYLVTLIPLSWCLNILLNSNFILRMIEWQAEAGCLTIRIHGKQWYWVYKYDLQNVYSTLSTPKNIGNRRWFVSHPEGSVLFDTYNQLAFAKLQNISQKEYLEEALVKDFNPTSSFTIFKETPVQLAPQQWPVNFPHNVKPISRFSKPFISYPILHKAYGANYDTLFAEVYYNKNTPEKAANPKTASQIIPKLRRARFNKPKTTTIAVSPSNKARFKALVSFPKLSKIKPELRARFKTLVSFPKLSKIKPELRARFKTLVSFPKLSKIKPELRARFKVLSTFVVKKHLVSSLTKRFRVLANPLRKAFVLSPTLRARFRALFVLPTHPRSRPELRKRFQAIATLTYKKSRLHSNLRARFATIWPQATKNKYSWAQQQPLTIHAELRGRLKALLELPKKPTPRVVYTKFTTFLRRILQQPVLIKQGLLTRFKALSNVTTLLTPRQRLRVRFQLLLKAAANNWRPIVDAKLQRIGLSVFNKLTGKAAIWQNNAYKTSAGQNVAVTPESGWLNAGLLVKKLTALKFKYIKLTNSSNSGTNPLTSPVVSAQERQALEVYPVSADLENEAFASTFFSDMLAVDANTKIGHSATPTSFYENAMLDDDWEVYSNTRLQDSEAPVRILQHIPQKDNGMFSLRFLDSNESLIEKPDENIEFLVIKQKRYKRKQGFKLLNAHPVAEEWVESGSAAPTSRFLKNNLIFTQIADIGASSSYSYYSSIRLNRTRSEAFSVNLARRLLRTSRTLVLPAYTNLSIIANSYDVVHSWFIPGLGIKMDCVPGKSTHHSLYIDNVGLYYGQCAEICGRYHHHMPIRICALPFDHFILWWTAKGLPKVLKMRYDLKKLDETLLTKYVW